MMVVAAAGAADAADWSRMRRDLWPDGSLEEHAADIAQALKQGSGLNLIARSSGGIAIGFAEASLRHDYVNGCTTSPVAFLEGIYVAPDFRRHGVARRLVDAVEAWAQSQGCTELASDAALDNSQSRAMHDALGFAETERVVYFRKFIG